ncbi:MAG TPA: COX15/CtaA family protein [Dongiaceae bacterium]|jgi:cytochrome c oxidase assembly protein subunit 15|nr:COX15/CtaA family protein [Dongiaceae bacterium]
MAESKHQVWLHRFAVVTALATAVLIGVGGLVTSKGAGMSVPDWPTSYGYNMFALPFKYWKGGAFFEHTHRLAASLIGFLTTIMMVWLWLKEPRRWMRWLGVIAFFAVVLQGVLGGLRVVLFKDQIGIFHAALAQAFLVLVCALALFTSRWWRQLPGQTVTSAQAALRPLLLGTTIIIFAQLVLGATMRHQHAGLAIPDFPLAYGKLWPATDAASVARYNQERIEITAPNAITATQIILQMAHRIMAVIILGAVTLCAWQSRRKLGGKHPLARVSTVWLGLILTQVALGAWTIWSNKAADVATAHVVVGALSLVTGAMLTIVGYRCLSPLTAAQTVSAKRTSSLPHGATQMG